MLNDARGCSDGTVNQRYLRHEGGKALLHVSRILSMQSESRHSDQTLEVILVEGGRTVDEAEDVAEPSRRVGCETTRELLRVWLRQRYRISRKCVRD